ncbi:hypothetical protein [Rubrobacter indicoceani]|uniref:hypothetical protein n=1 Tax=Rubrobacter indicoceani TaxID=2051957 RepID=UPI000E5C5319|nr:hypothetical protein [Rubrobacter indicoceani]
MRFPIGLGLACLAAATVFGFGSEVFSAGFFYSGDEGRAQVVLLGRLVALVALAVMLVFRGGWGGVVVALTMALGATFIEWLLLPVAFDWAAAQAPPELARQIPDGITRPPYLLWAAGDLLSVGFACTLTQVGRMLFGMK